jgi:hypothetical protein
VSLESPKPFGGLLRGKERGSALDSLGPARTTLAPSFCGVSWGVMLPEEARAVVGEWCGECACVPPASRTAAPLRAVDTKSVLSGYSRVLPRLRRINVLQ